MPPILITMAIAERQIRPSDHSTSETMPKPTVLLQSILADNAIVRELILDGPKKASILEGAKQQINSLNPQEKALFLKGTFTILANPNSASQDQDKRDAALELLRITDLTSVGPEKLTEIYADKIEKLNGDSDPLGEVYALLEAGKIIAPFITTARLRINLAWKDIALYFTENDKQIILKGVREIMKLGLTRQGKSDQDILGEPGKDTGAVVTSKKKRKGKRTEQNPLFQQVKSLRVKT